MSGDGVAHCVLVFGDGVAHCVLVFGDGVADCVPVSGDGVAVLRCLGMALLTGSGVWGWRT